MRSWSEITLEELMQAEVLQTIIFKFDVPTEQEVKVKGNKLDLSKSDLNACYSKPTINPWNGESQSWFDVKLTVRGEYDLPSEKEWFYVVTERGRFFKAHFSGKKNRKLVSLSDPRILGKITKGGFAEEEMCCNMCYQINFTKDDPERKWIITEEMLEEHGISKVILKKTNKTKEDKRGNKRDIWLIDRPIIFDFLQECYEWKHRPFHC